jgi:transposase
MKRYSSDVTDAQWGILYQLIPEPKRREDGRGRPWKGHREVLNGILYILRTGVAWADLPDCYPPYQTCHRRFQQWLQSGVMGTLLKALPTDLLEKESRVRRRLLSASADYCPAVSDANSSGHLGRSRLQTDRFSGSAAPEANQKISDLKEDPIRP